MHNDDVEGSVAIDDVVITVTNFYGDEVELIIERLRQIFKAADADNSRSLSYSEFADLSQFLDGKGESTDEASARMLKVG